MNEKERKERDAFSRVANRIRNHSRQNGKDISMTEARDYLGKQLREAANRKKNK